MKLFIVGVVGIPANYGGFEALAENLVRFNCAAARQADIFVFCSRDRYVDRPARHLGASLKYLPFDANGASSVIYDGIALFESVLARADVILLLGTSGAIWLPFVRAICGAKIIVNIDGLEWQRGKWKGLRGLFLRFSEWIAVKFAHSVVADNEAIARYIASNYGIQARTIAYGGDHALVRPVAPDMDLPDSYALAVCRIEPENNVDMILSAFSKIGSTSLVFVGNWSHSEYARNLRRQFGWRPNVRLLDPIYDLHILSHLRSRATCYVHGHSAGGTNPSLVEAMHFGREVLAFDCEYNRTTTEGAARYFGDSDSLFDQIVMLTNHDVPTENPRLRQIAESRYTWRVVGEQYFRLFGCE